MLKLTEKEIKKFKLGTRSILEAAFARNVNVYKLLKNERVFILEKDGKTFWLRGPRISLSNPVSLWLIRDKFLTKEVLKNTGVPYPEGYVAKNIKEAEAIAKKIGFPLVIKPLRFEGGKGVYLNVDSMEKVKDFFLRSSKYDKNILLEKQAEGNYYRITMINYEVGGVLETRGIELLGDGTSDVKQLVLNYNSNHKIKYKITEKTEDILIFQNLKVNDIPKKGVRFILGFSGSGGGEWIDRTDVINPETVKLLKKLMVYLDLKVAGVDIIAKDISLPITSKNSPGYLLEINGAPEFTFHLKPTEGKSINIGEKIIDMLFNKN
jgi:cyanophycin synthetase